jgi:multisubunit Na+/H+ antiporter MnhE subunit
MLLWVCWWAAFMAAWMLLVATLESTEIAAGIAAAAVAATVAEIVRVQDYRRFSPRPRWFLRALRLPRQVLTDTVVAFRVLIRRIATGDRRGGAFRALRFEPGGDDGRAAARRALTVAALSLSPNTYVVGLDEDEGLLLVHQLEPSPHDRARRDILGKL